MLITNNAKEKDIERSIRAYISKMGAYELNINSGALTKSHNNKSRVIRMARKGTPDIICCIKGRFVAIEVKRDQKELQKWHKDIQKGNANSRAIDQHRQMQKIVNAGGIAMCVCTVSEVASILKEHSLI